MWIAWIIFNIIIGLLVYTVANNKGHTSIGWFFYGFFLNLIALIHVTFLKDITKET